MTNPDLDSYGLSPRESVKRQVAPRLEYLPPRPRIYSPLIAIIGTGGISQHHLRAYRDMGLNVAILCDLDRERAEQRRNEFYPQAQVTSNFEEAIHFPGVEVVDVTTHPRERMPIIEASLRMRKHVLSQKPFVLDLADGERLVELASRHNVNLAVNQNGRWAPHFRYIHQAIQKQLIGPIGAIDFVLNWDHTWTEKTPFNKIHHLLLFDFAIHWFDIISVWMGDQSAERVFASVRRTTFQTAEPPFLAHALIDFPHAQARLNLNANVLYGQKDQTTVTGHLGTLRASGPNLNEQRVELWNTQGMAVANLTGAWFDSGFEGTMGELLCAIEQQREPSNSARDNLRSLALCFAAIASANQGVACVPGTVRCCPV